MKRLATSGLLSLVALLAITSSADAGLGWCRRDPIVLLNGVRVQILVSIPQAYEWNVTGPIQVTIATPPSISRQLLFTDAGFNGHGEQVYWGDLSTSASGGFPVSISVSVPTDLPHYIPMQVDVIPDVGAPSTVGGENVGLTVMAWIAGEKVTTHAVYGADAGGPPVASPTTPAVVDPGPSAPVAAPTTDPVPSVEPMSRADAARAEARARREQAAN